jgi:hypothetical protein
VCVGSIRYPAGNEYAPHYIVVCGLSGSKFFTHIIACLTNGTTFFCWGGGLGEVAGHRLSVSILSTNFVRNISNSKTNAVRYKKCTLSLHVQYPFSGEKFQSCSTINRIYRSFATKVSQLKICEISGEIFNTLRTGDADLRFYIRTVQDG